MKIAGPEKAKERIAYLYNNPTKADLEDTIEAYPGLNSWQDFLSGGGSRTVTKVPRTKVPTLKNPGNLYLRSKKTAQSPGERKLPAVQLKNRAGRLDAVLC